MLQLANIPEVFLATDEQAQAATDSGRLFAGRAPCGAVIAFKDFVPKQVGIKSGIFGGAPVYADLTDAVASANRWIGQEKIQVLNVETVVLPGDAGTDQTVVGFIDVHSCLQVIRVWYLPRLTEAPGSSLLRGRHGCVGRTRGFARLLRPVVFGQVYWTRVTPKDKDALQGEDGNTCGRQGVRYG